MHKLGVKAMSLYYYVENKEDVLDGIVGLLWSEIDRDAIAQADLRRAARYLACSLRDLVHRHPQAAPLLMSWRVATAPQLRVYAACLSALEEAGFSRDRAWELLRILVAYGFGYAQAEQTAFAPPASERRGHPGPWRWMSAVPGDLPGELVEVARGAWSAAITVLPSRSRTACIGTGLRAMCCFFSAHSYSSCNAASSRCHLLPLIRRPGCGPRRRQEPGQHR